LRTHSYSAGKDRKENGDGDDSDSSQHRNGQQRVAFEVFCPPCFSVQVFFTVCLLLSSFIYRAASILPVTQASRQQEGSDDELAHFLAGDILSPTFRSMTEILHDRVAAADAAGLYLCERATGKTHTELQ